MKDDNLLDIAIGLRWKPFSGMGEAICSTQSCETKTSHHTHIFHSAEHSIKTLQEPMNVPHSIQHRFLFFRDPTSIFHPSSYSTYNDKSARSRIYVGELSNSIASSTSRCIRESQCDRGLFVVAFENSSDNERWWYIYNILGILYSP